MELTQQMLDIPIEHMSNVFGKFDAWLKQIEKYLQVTMVVRDGSLKIMGNDNNVQKAQSVMSDLLAMSRKGNDITEQTVTYALEMCGCTKNHPLLEADSEIICHTVQGKPVKPKTLGQKDYVDQIRNKMIVFGIGPAGTGKTYLAMAMAITAFKNEEVSRIILPDLPLRQARNSDFFREISRVRSIRICVLCMMLCIRSWEQRVF